MIFNLDVILSNTKRVASGCLEWSRCFNSDGYPRATFEHTKSNGKVHREVFFLVHGYYPEVVRHKCDNPRCIDPDHLEGGNHLDNEADKRARNRIPNQISEEVKKRVCELKDSGSSYKEIAGIVGRSRNTVEYVLYRRRKVKG